MADRIDPAMRAHLDRELSGAVDGLLAKAAGYDGVDIIEANVAFTHDLLAELDVSQLAVAAAALALRLHRHAAVNRGQ